MQDYPEHRLHFFSLLRAITNNCFSTLFAMSPEQLRLVINSIIWAFRHTVRLTAPPPTPLPHPGVGCTTCLLSWLHHSCML